MVRKRQVRTASSMRKRRNSEVNQVEVNQVIEMAAMMNRHESRRLADVLGHCPDQTRLG
jgi:hypothetical protein